MMLMVIVVGIVFGFRQPDIDINRITTLEKELEEIQKILEINNYFWWHYFDSDIVLRDSIIEKITSCIDNLREDYNDLLFDVHILKINKPEGYEYDHHDSDKWFFYNKEKDDWWTYEEDLSLNLVWDSSFK